MLNGKLMSLSGTVEYKCTRRVTDKKPLTAIHVPNLQVVGSDNNTKIGLEIWETTPQTMVDANLRPKNKLAHQKGVKLEA